MIDEKKKIRSLEISVGNHLVIDSTTTNWIDFWNATKLSAFHVKRKSLNDNEFLLTHTFVLDVPLLWNTGSLSHLLVLLFLIENHHITLDCIVHFDYWSISNFFVVLILVNWNYCFSRMDLCFKNKLTRDIALIVQNIMKNKRTFLIHSNTSFLMLLLFYLSDIHNQLSGIVFMLGLVLYSSYFLALGIAI